MLTSTHASRMQSGTVRKNVRRMAEKIGAALRFLDFSEMKEMQHRDYAPRPLQRSGLGSIQDMSAATGHPADACGGNLRRKTIGHHAIIFDANVFPYTETAGVLCMDKYLLGCAEVAA